MTRRRPLSGMLINVFDAVIAARTDRVGVVARRVELTLPIEVSLEEIEDEQTFVADVPAWRWRTAFDQVPGTMHITWEAEVSRP